MRRIAAVLIFVVVGLIVPFISVAQSAPASASVTVPRLIQITGVFQPVDGQAPSAVEIVTLSVYADADGGLPVWQERQTVAIEQTTGRFTLLLGASDPAGIPAAVFASGDGQWMSLLFERAGEREQARVRIASVPYALKASDAETLGGLPASAYLRAPTTAETPEGSSAKTSTLTSAALTAAETPSLAAVLPGTTNFLAKYVNASDVGNSAIYETPTASVPTGAVGIGTTTPLDQLHLRFNNSNGAITGLAVQNLGNTTTSYSGMLFYDQFGALGQFQGFNNVTHEYRINNIASNASINFMTGSTSRFVIRNGNIGIGTTTPSALLEVSNAVPGGPANMWMTSYTNFVGPYYLARRARGTAAAPAAVQNGDGLAGFFGHGHGTSGFGGQASGMEIQAAQNWTDTAQGTRISFFTTDFGTTVPVNRMTLGPLGYLGLGTNAPDAVVDVVRQNDSADFRATNYGNGDPKITTRKARGTVAAPSAVLTGDQLGFLDMTGYGTTDFGDGGAAIGAFAAENWTDTANGTAIGLFATPLGSTQSEANVVVAPGGNVGIGLFNAIPTIPDKLQVFGDIRVGTTGTNGCIRNFAGTGLIGVCSSDRRFKKDITPFSPVLNQLAALQPVHYFWRAADFPQQHFGDSRAYGLIAQDVEEVLPELVVTGEDGFKAVDYTKLPLLTIQAVKELKAENEALKAGQEVLQQRVAQTDALKQRVAENDARIDALERLVREMLAKAAER